MLMSYLTCVAPAGMAKHPERFLTAAGPRDGLLHTF
jgi:hypothetical protein